MSLPQAEFAIETVHLNVMFLEVRRFRKKIPNQLPLRL